jgi:hypothetical protein
MACRSTRHLLPFFLQCVACAVGRSTGTTDRRPCAEVLEFNLSRQPSPPDPSFYHNSLPDPLTETLHQIGGGSSLESR